MVRIIGHLDMDAFFAAVEERDRPDIKGKPIVIGSDPKNGKGRGVVSTANYEARKFGIHSAMPISIAWRLAEEARIKGALATIFLEGNHRKYSEVSSLVMEIIRSNSSTVEEASIDEAYFDMSDSGSFEAAKTKAITLKEDILNKIGLTCSIGVGPNKLISKIASDFKKPNGLTVVTTEEAESFLANMPVRKIPGVGPKTEDELDLLGVSKISDIKKFSESELNGMFGKWGTELYLKSKGLDDSPLVENWEAKSIGEQETLEEDSLDPLVLMELINHLSKDVMKRFSLSGFKKFGGVHITVRFEDFSTKTRSHSTPHCEDVPRIAYEAMQLFLPFLDNRENPKRKKVRLLGVRVEKLEP